MTAETICIILVLFVVSEITNGKNSNFIISYYYKMDVLEQKPPLQYKDELKKLLKLLTYKNHRLELKGSSSLSTQRYFSDYDLFSVFKKPDQNDFMSFLKGVLKKIEDSDDLWFMELKLQTTGKRPKKIRVYPNQPLKEGDVEKVWDKLDFIKLDLIARIENRFTEVSVIYSFTLTPPTKEEYKKSLNDDIAELRKEKKWYKVLKRQFSIFRAEKDKKQLLRLSKVFNGDLGKEYQLLSNLEALQKVLEFYQEPSLIDKVRVNLKDLHLPPEVKSINKWLKARSKKLNESAKEFL